MMRRPPGAPTARTGRPSRTAITWAMLDAGRLRGATELANPGRGSNRFMLSLSSTPVPGTVTAEPKMSVSVCVTETMLPAASTTDRCVVQPSSALAPVASVAGMSPVIRAPGPGFDAQQQSISALRSVAYAAEVSRRQSIETKSGSPR